MTTFFVRRNEDRPVKDALILETRSNLSIGETDFEQAFGDISSLESDLLLLGASVFAADRTSARGEREDRQRRIELNIPVTNLGRLLPFQSQIEFILRTLSNDGWRLEFRQSAGVEEEIKLPVEGEGRTLLFSGGLDSLAAAIEFGLNGSVQLVSHKTHNRQTAEAQKELARVLIDAGMDLPHFQFFVSSKDGGPSHLEHAREDSQRTRSFLFLILAGLSARRAGQHELVYLAENGQMAIHLPITSGRIGSFSTHTAHPDFLVLMESFLSSVFQLPMRITNPYVTKTKAEITRIVVDSFPSLIPISQSCWKNSRLPAGITHCGECIPCYVRRIAVEYCVTSDPTVYQTDAWSTGTFQLDLESNARRNLADLAEFIQKIEKYSNEEIMSEWPELYSRNLNSTDVIDMYRRFSAEAKLVLGRYPSLEPLLI